MPQVFPDILTKCDCISHNLNLIVAKNTLCIKMLNVNNDKVNLHLHISTLTYRYGIKRFWESHLALHFQVIRKVMRNFTHKLYERETEVWNI